MEAPTAERGELQESVNAAVASLAMIARRGQGGRGGLTAMRAFESGLAALVSLALAAGLNPVWIVSALDRQAEALNEKARAEVEDGEETGG